MPPAAVSPTKLSPAKLLRVTSTLAAVPDTTAPHAWRSENPAKRLLSRVTRASCAYTPHRRSLSTASSSSRTPEALSSSSPSSSLSLLEAAATATAVLPPSPVGCWSPGPPPGAAVTVAAALGEGDEEYGDKDEDDNGGGEAARKTLPRTKTSAPPSRSKLHWLSCSVTSDTTPPAWPSVKRTPTTQ